MSPSRLVACLALLLSTSTAHAAPDVPEPLQEWIPWAIAGHEDAACAQLRATPVCAWPGRLTLDLDDQGGRFELDVRVDAPVVVPLPGDAARWPRDVRDGGATASLAKGERPAVRLEPGTRRLTGSFRWARLPESLAVPPTFALVDLTVRGREVRSPRRDQDGLLWLQAGAAEEADEDRLALEVHRAIDDGVPAVITTRLRLRVSGRSREVDLGSPVLAGTIPTRLSSGLPARLDGDGALQVQLRPGDWEITVAARSAGPVPELVAPANGAPWPDEEVWVFSASPHIRSVRVDGAPGVDPARTSLPEAWRTLPAWRVAAGGGLQFVELRRGVADPPPDRLTVRRELWLALDGDEFAVRDTVTGAIFAGGRLEMPAPGSLGRAAIGGRDQLITQGDDGSGGVEVRDGSVSMLAASLWDRAPSLPAVGWNRDAQSLDATLHLPPGWRLLAASGVDHASGSWLTRWTLMDLFLVLLISLAVGRLTSRPWVFFTLAVLVLTWQEPGAPQGEWIGLLVVLGLLRVLPRGGFARLTDWIRWAIVLGLTVTVTVFCWEASRAALFPQLSGYAADPLGGGGYDQAGWDAPVQAAAVQEDLAWEEEQKEAAKPAGPVARKKIRSADYASTSGVGFTKRASRLDPQAVVQTGPGLPRWSWTRHQLQWNGPVSADHTFRLHLIGPVASGALGLAQVGGVLTLLLLLAAPARTGTRLPPADPTPEPTPPEELGPGGGDGDADPVDAADGDEADDTVEDGPPAEPGVDETDPDATKTIGRSSLPKMSPVLLALAALVGSAPAPAAAQGFPSPELLGALEARVLKRPACEPNCVQTAAITLRADSDGLRLTAEVHAAALAPWTLPGPDSAWAPRRVLLDGAPVVALHRDDQGFLVLRVPEGVHTVELSGPSRDEVSLQFGTPPRVLDWIGDGWTLAGHREGAPPPSSVQLSRSRPLADGGADDGQEGAELAPWLQVHRELDLGVPWLVHNQVQRIGGGQGAVLLRVPLLEGESVTTPGIPQEGREAIVALAPGEGARAWDSTLAEAATVTLSAPTDRPWTEVWSLDCSPIWSCSADGPAPTRHLSEGRWLPQWKPWPGESLTLNLRRPDPAEGVTTTVDATTLTLTSGRRLLEGALRVELRSSQGGEQALTLPPGAEMRSFRLGGKDHPAQTQGDRVVFAIEPGAQTVEVDWSLPADAGLLQTAPPVSIGQDAANVQIEWSLPDHRWVLWTWGPRWGPVVTVWQYLLLLVLAAYLLARFAPTPLRGHDWFLLGLGMTQVPPALTLVLVLWLIALSKRGEWRPTSWWMHGFVQLSLVGLTLIALGVLWAAVYQGLVVRPDLGVSGAGSYGNTLRWFTDASGPELPRPGVLWLPIWAWRAAMLLWALWLASRLLRWLQWGWEQLRAGGLWSRPQRSTPTR